MRKMILFLIALASSLPVYAHKPSDSYLSLKIHGPELQGQWEIALRDLDYAIGIDGNGDGDITWGELRARENAISAYALARLRISSDGALCAKTMDEQMVDTHSDGAYNVIKFTVNCASVPRMLTLGYSLFSDIDPQHRGLLRLDDGVKTRSAIFSPERANQEFTFEPAGVFEQFCDYLRAGIWHIWTGYDHILFLIALLLPSVLQRNRDGWQGVNEVRVPVIDTLKIVTAFTLAHSITLSLAVLDVVRPPSRFVESVIAASIIIATLNNIYPVFNRRRWLIAFAFGLMHGFGFALVLIELGLTPGLLALSLAAFNVGVETGQIAIVCVFLPLALLARQTWLYQRLVMTAGSWLIITVAGAWLVQRAFNLQLVPG